VRIRVALIIYMLEKACILGLKALNVLISLFDDSFESFDLGLHRGDLIEFSEPHLIIVSYLAFLIAHPSD
jgi:hypothetical protein